MALAKLGEVMNDVDWRTQRRLAGVPSRPPPSRPDRGYVEQPEERVEPTVVRKRGLIPMSDLEREQLNALEEELKALEAPPLPPAQLTLQPQPETQPSQPPATEPAEMPKAKKQTRLRREPEEIARIVQRVFDAGHVEGKKKGVLARVASEEGVASSLLHRWVSIAAAKQDQPATQTLMSSRLAPPPISQMMAPSSQLPPVPTVTLTGLEEYVRALVAQEVKVAIRKAFGGE